LCHSLRDRDIIELVRPFVGMAVGCAAAVGLDPDMVRQCMWGVRGARENQKKNEHGCSMSESMSVVASERLRSHNLLEYLFGGRWQTPGSKL